MVSEVSQPPSISRAVFIAALISLLVTAIRLYGEQHDWAPVLFSKEPGGGLALISISWLVLPFGFWFGRRLAQNGHRPASTRKALLLPLVGVGIFAAGVTAAVQLITDWQAQGIAINVSAVLAGAVGLIAWRRAWFVCVCYGILARIPVILVQYESVQRGWDNHYTKGPPDAPPEQTLFLLTIAQCMLWPFGFTALFGGFFAALGALTVRRS